MHMLSGKIGTRLWSIPLHSFIGELGIAKVWGVQDPGCFTLYCPILVVGLAFTYEIGGHPVLMMIKWRNLNEGFCRYIFMRVCLCSCE